MGESTTASRRRPGRGVRRPAQRPHNADPNAATRVEILKSAAKAFRKLGYHGATVEEIASALQMKKGNLYYYLRNKEEILFACHQYSLDRLMQLQAEAEASGVARDDKRGGVNYAVVGHTNGIKRERCGPNRNDVRVHVHEIFFRASAGVESEPKTLFARPPAPVPLERIRFSLNGVSNVRE